MAGLLQAEAMKEVEAAVEEEQEEDNTCASPTAPTPSKHGQLASARAWHCSAASPSLYP